MVLIASMMVPFATKLIPMFRMFSNMGLLNSFWAIILPAVGAPFLIFFFRQNTEAFPGDTIEAARVDGATNIQQFFKITMPMLKPITYLVVTLGIIWSFQVFDLSYQMTGGGPGRSTVTIVMAIYNAAFKQYKMGYACAMAMVLLVIVLIINGLENLLFKEKEAR